MDFGVKYLGSPSHGNLKFRLKEGEDIPANSMIISYNSPVIESLTTDLMQTSVDVDDFSEDAVQCFLESCYSGKLQKITRTNFRDANKMSNVFEVAWLVKRCFEYFGNLLDEMDTDSFEDQNYLFEEAMFMWGTLKNRNFVEVVIKRFSYEIVKCDQFFVPQYLIDIPSHTTKQLDVIIEMAKEKKHILMEVLIDDIKENSDSISANSRYILQNSNFTTDNTGSYKEKLFDTLSALKSPSKEDFGLILELFKQTDKSLSDHIQKTPKCISIPNCRFLKFRLIKDYPEINKMIEFLATFSLVDNSYIFFDAVLCWANQNSYSGNGSIYGNLTPITVKFNGVIRERSWKPLVSKYLVGKDRICPGMAKMIAEIKRIPAFKSYKNYSRVVSVNDYSPQEFLQQDNDIKFFFKHPNTEKCQVGEKCGFIVRVTGSFKDVDDSFDIKVVIDPKLYPSDIHFNSQCTKVANMHLALEIKNIDCDYPVTWSGKPCKDGSDKYYVWGQHRFSKQGEGSFEQSDFKLFYYHGSDARIRPVIYSIN